MTGHAAGVVNIFGMRLGMAFSTYWFIAMASMVAFTAGHVSVSAFEIDDFILLLGVAGITTLGENLKIGQTADRSMRITVAAQAVEKGLAVGGTMTGGAFW